jgi:hypothetical protein
MSDKKNPAGDTPVDRLAKFAVEWPKGTHRDDAVVSLETGGARESVLNVSDLLAVLSDRADLLAALVRLRDTDVNCSQEEDRAAWAQAHAAIAKATQS